MRWLRFGALTALLVLCSFSGAASAEEGAAAVLPFQGPQAAKVRQSVQKGLRAADVRLIPLKKVNAVVKKTKGYAKQAARLDASVLVRTRVRRVEGRWIADTEVRNKKGQRIKKMRSSSSSLGRLSNRIVGLLMKTGLMPVAGAAAEDEPEEPDQPRLVVRPFKGTQAAKVRVAAVRGLLEEKVELYPNKQFVGKARSLGASLQSDGGHVAPATALAVSGLIEGDVLREDGIWSAYVRLVDGRSPTVISQHYYDASTLNALMKSVERNIGPDFRKDIEKLGVKAPAAVAVVPAAPVPEAPVEKAPEPEEPEARKARPSDRPAAVDIELDFRMTRRNFSYRDTLPDDPRGDLRDYQLGFGPGVALKFQYFPGAHFTAGVGAQFGIDFEWDRLFDFNSTRADGASFPTESQQFLVGVRWRYPIKRWEPFMVLDWGVHTFRFGVSGPPVPGEDNTAGIPGVKYEFVRIGPGFRVVIGKKEIIVLAMNIAFRGVYSVGGIGTELWFPQAKANGMDTGLVLGFALPLGFEIRLGLDYRRYGFSLNPQPPDATWVAGGAVDQYLGFSVGVAWRR